MPADPAAPDWRGLLAIGLDRLRDARTYAWFFGSSVALSLVDGLSEKGGALGGAISLAAGLASMYTSMVLARQLMTGQLAIWPQDLRNFTSLLAVWFLAALAIGTPVVVVVVLFGLAGSATTGLLVVAVPWAATMLYFISRSAFFLPALAIDDPVTFWQAFERGQPYWARLAVVFVIAFAPAVVLGLGLATTGLPWPIRSVLGALVGAAAALVSESAACYLYWRHARAGG